MATPAIPEQSVVDQTKRCAKCGADLPFAAFYRRYHGGPVGSWCRKCQKASARHSYHDPAKAAARALRLKQECAELREASRNQRLMPFSEIGRRLGLSPQGALNVYRDAMAKLRLVVTPAIRELLIEAVNLKGSRPSSEERWADVLGEDES